MRRVSLIISLLVLLLFASCAHVKRFMGVMSPEAQAAKAFVKDNKTLLMKLSNCLPLTVSLDADLDPREAGFKTSDPQNFRCADVSKDKEYEKLNEKCTDALRADKITIEQHSKNTPGKFPSRQWLRIGGLYSMSTSQICDLVANFNADELAEEYAKRRATLEYVEAREAFEKAKSELKSDPNDSLKMLSDWLHPDAHYIPRFADDVTKFMERFGSTKSFDMSLVEKLRNDVKAWAKVLVEMAGTPKMRRGELRYGHVMRMLKKHVKSQTPRRKVRRVACNDWKFTRNNIGIVTHRYTLCEYIVKVEGESGCREFHLKYKEERVGRSFRKSKEQVPANIFSDGGMWLYTSTSRPIQCR